MVAARFRLHRVVSGELPAAAARVVALGISTPALEELACLRPEDTDEARALFLDSLRELGIEPPNDIDALTIFARKIAADIVAGRVSPRDGADEITDSWESVDCPSLPWISTFAKASIDWDYLPKTPEEINEAIQTAARELLDG